MSNDSDVCVDTDTDTDTDTDDSDVYEVEKIVGHSEWNGQRYYKIRWKNFGPVNDTDECEKDLNCPLILQNYKDSVLDKFDVIMDGIVNTVFKEGKFEDHRLPELFEVCNEGTFFHGYYAFMVAKNRPEWISGDEALDQFEASSPSDYTCVFAITEDERHLLYSKEKNTMLDVPAASVFDDERFSDLLDKFYENYHEHTVILETLQDEIQDDEFQLESTTKYNAKWKAVFRYQCFRKWYAKILGLVMKKPLSTRDLWITLREEYEYVKCHDPIDFCWAHVIGMANKFFDSIFYDYEPPVIMSAAMDKQMM